MESNRPVSIFALLGEGGQLPSQGYSHDAGFDLFLSSDVAIRPQSFVDVPTAVSVAIPNTHWGLLIGRSSTIRRYGLRVETAIIDAGYRGELFIGIWNLSDKLVTLERGTRLAQLVPIERTAVLWTEVEYLPPSDRGERGFGSSGT